MTKLSSERVIDRRHRRIRRRGWERQQKPQQHRHRQNDPTDTFDEDHRALIQANEQVTDVRPTVCRQFEQQRVFGFVFAPLLQKPRHDQRRNDARDIQAKQHESLQVDWSCDLCRRNERTDQQCINRQTCRTRHQRRDENCRQSIARIGNASRRHNARHSARKRRQQRNERTSGQTG